MLNKYLSGSCKEGKKVGGREAEREGGRKGGKKGGREEGREGGRRTDGHAHCGASLQWVLRSALSSALAGVCCPGCRRCRGHAALASDPFMNCLRGRAVPSKVSPFSSTSPGLAKAVTVSTKARPVRLPGVHTRGLWHTPLCLRACFQEKPARNSHQPPVT